MKTNRIIQSGVLAALVALAAQPAVAGLKINLVNLGGQPPSPPTIAGGGNLQDIMEVAAKNWERVYNKGGSKWDLTIEYQWGQPTGGAYGDERMQEQGGSPVRITRALVTFRNTPVPNQNVYNWYADPTPKKNSAYKTYETTEGELFDDEANSAGFINVGRVFSGATGSAVGRVDLLTVAMHEIGHALGLDTEYHGWEDQTDGSFITITPPLPYAGAFIALSMGYADHISIFTPLPLMVSDPTPGERQLISGLDALVLAQFSSFDRPDLGEPPGVPKGK